MNIHEQGLFQLFWEKAPGLNWGKKCGIFFWGGGGAVLVVF